jgi:hypothetical protein
MSTLIQSAPLLLLRTPRALRDQLLLRFPSLSLLLTPSPTTYPTPSSLLPSRPRSITLLDEGDTRALPLSNPGRYANDSFTDSHMLNSKHLEIFMRLPLTSISEIWHSSAYMKMMSCTFQSLFFQLRGGVSSSNQSFAQKRLNGKQQHKLFRTTRKQKPPKTNCLLRAIL